MTSEPASAEYVYKSLTEPQKMALALLPIPSSILSIVGSSTIIYMVYQSHKIKPWTPYNRLLLAMSLSDILSSITLAIGAFLNPQETSTKAWAFGNEDSCSAVGFLNQLSYWGIFYNGMLSFYFLLTARFAMKNEKIATRIEPAMHIFSIAFPLVTAIAGLVMGVYDESEVNIGCWVNNYPRNCGYLPGSTGEECLSPVIAWIFGGWVAILVLASLFINNLVIFVFVRKQTRRSNRFASSGSSTALAPPDPSESNNEDDDYNVGHGTENSLDEVLSVASSFRTLPVRPSSAAQSRTDSSKVLGEKYDYNQQRRLRLVASQGMLFVLSYFVSNIWTYVLRLYEAVASSYEEERELPYKNFGLLVLQASLLPMQGLFNMFVYIRPKYMKNRHEYPLETRIWVFRRCLFGSSVEPLHSQNLMAKMKKENLREEGIKKQSSPRPDTQSKIPGNRISSLTVNSNDQVSRSEGPGKERRSRFGTSTSSLGAIREVSIEKGSSQFLVGATSTERENVEITEGAKDASTDVPMASLQDDSCTDFSIMMPTGWSSSLDSLPLHIKEEEKETKRSSAVRSVGDWTRVEMDGTLRNQDSNFESRNSSENHGV